MCVPTLYMIVVIKRFAFDHVVVYFEVIIIYKKEGPLGPRVGSIWLSHIYIYIQTLHIFVNAIYGKPIDLTMHVHVIVVSFLSSKYSETSLLYSRA
jgi:hypothetical protein